MQTAAQQKAELARSSERLISFAQANASVLTYHQRALLRDTVGLVSLLSNHESICSQPRIRDNIVELVSIFDSQNPHDLPVDIDEQVEQILSVLAGLTAVGCTVEGYTSMDRKWSNRERS